jgi:hypothetical protein
MRLTFILLLACAGCGHSGAGLEPEYAGCATDENWPTLDDSEKNAIVGDATAPAITAPASGATLPFATRPTFTWKRSPTDNGAPDGNVPHPAKPPYAATPGCTDCCPNFETGGLSTMHLPPISGDVFDLQFSAGSDVIHRVLSTLQEWRPTDATWSLMRGKSLTLKIYRLGVLRNDPREGPFTPAAPFSFSVGG